MEGGTECERGVFRAKRKRERVSATPIERHQKIAEAVFRLSLCAAKPHKGSSERAVDYYTVYESIRNPAYPSCVSTLHTASGTSYLTKFVQTRVSCSGRGTEERAAARLLIIQAILLPRARMV